MMKITMQANDLAAALGKVRGAIAPRMTIPIIEKFLFEAADGRLTITASQIDLQISISIDCDVAGSMRRAVAPEIYAVMKALGKTTIMLEEAENDRIVVTGNRQRYEFATLAADDFPIMAAIANDEGAVRFEVDVKEFRSALEATRQTMSQTSDHLKGVRLFVEGGALTAISTDRHRLVLRTLPIPAGAESLEACTIPAGAVGEICTTLSGVEGDAMVEASSRAIGISAAGVSLISRLIAMEFINHRAGGAMNERATCFRVAAGELKEAIARIVALRVETKAPVVTVTTNGASIELKSDRRGINAGNETVDAEVNEEAEFSVSTAYLSTLVGLWPESAVLDVASAGGGKPIRISSASVPAMLQVVMPMTP